MTAPRREVRTLFDTHIVVDWSARSVPSPARPVGDAIWWCAARDGAVGEPEYARTRHDAVRRLGAILARECAAGRRVLAGFDFPFGYPAGFAGHLTGRASGPAVWDWLADRIRDGEDNANNRYAIAGSINRVFRGWARSGEGPGPGAIRISPFGGGTAAAGISSRPNAVLRTVEPPVPRRSGNSPMPDRWVRRRCWGCPP